MDDAGASTEIYGTPYAYSTALFSRLDALESRLTGLRRNGALSPAVLSRIRDFFRIKQIHNSNAIEGNKLSLGETRVVVETGLTISGKPLKDVAEAKNLAGALELLEQLASKAGKEWEPIHQSDVKSLHSLVLHGIDDDNAGRYRTQDVQITGSAFAPPSPLFLNDKMEEFFRGSRR